MNEGHEKAIDYAAGLVRDMRADVATLDTRVSAWVMVGNGAALLLCLNAVLARQVCDWEAIKPFALLFSLGLAASFGSVFCSLVVSRRITVGLAEMVAASQTATIFYKRLQPEKE